MKRFLASILTSILLLVLVGTAWAQEYKAVEADFYFNTLYVPGKNIKPILVNDTIYVPAQALALIRNVMVFDTEKGAAIGIEVPGSKYGYYWVGLVSPNGEPGPVPVGFRYNGKIYVPLAPWAQLLGATVTYENGKIYVRQ
ncbi:MAG: hypothetical protein ACPLQP_11155 [Moorellaceae bacterium]